MPSGIPSPITTCRPHRLALTAGDRAVAPDTAPSSPGR